MGVNVFATTTMHMKPGSLLLLLALTVSTVSLAQADTAITRQQVAIFTPLYLDSAFADTAYRHGNSFPKYLNPGLEFYEGAVLAIDSLRKEGLSLDVHVFDTRSSKGNPASAIRNPAFDSMDLIIGHVNANETRLLAQYARSKNIPFVNATYPNDAGVSDNPDFVILNSTLLTHCEAMYRYIQTNHAVSEVVLFRKKGAQEDRLRAYFDDISKNTASVPLKIKYVTLDATFTPNDLRRHLTRNSSTVCIAGSLDVNFGKILTQQLSLLYDEYPTLLFGMPTWETLDLAGDDYKGVEVYVTTPFNLPERDSLAVRLTEKFKDRFYSRPTDMLYRGYESMYHFAHLLQLQGDNLSSSLADKRFMVITDFDIEPVLNPKTNTLDYFENKKIYFVRKVEGEVTGVF